MSLLRVIKTRSAVDLGGVPLAADLGGVDVAMGDAQAAGASTGELTAPPAFELPATDAKFNRLWRRFGKYGEAKRHELLLAAEAKCPLPVAEKERKSALSMREEVALVDFRRHLRGLSDKGELFCANFVLSYQRGVAIGGKPCLPPCNHTFGVEGGTASENQVRYLHDARSANYSHMPVCSQVWKHCTSANSSEEPSHDKMCGKVESKLQPPPL